MADGEEEEVVVVIEVIGEKDGNLLTSWHDHIYTCSLPSCFDQNMLAIHLPNPLLDQRDVQTQTTSLN